MGDVTVSAVHARPPSAPLGSSTRSNATSSNAKPKPRPSIRQSFNLSSMGKAIAEVMNKDKEREKEKSQPTSAINTDNPRARNSAAARPSLESNTRPPSVHIKRTRKDSALPIPAIAPSSEDMGVKTSEGTSAAVPRAGHMTLRPRKAPAPADNASSALPKYRPRSGIINEPVVVQKKPLTTKRKTKSSEDAKEDEDARPKSKTGEPKSNAVHEPIKLEGITSSPSHRRVALKEALASAVSVSPSRKASPKPSSHSSSPSHSSIMDGKVVSSRILASSASARSTPGGRSLKEHTGSSGTPVASSPLRSSLRSRPESPLARHSRRESKSNSLVIKMPALSKPPTGKVFEDSDGSDSSADEEDVEMLLAPSASPGAPTPAIPRIRERTNALQTPNRASVTGSKPTSAIHESPNQLPSRADMSYLSPPSDSSPSRRLDPKSSLTGAERGSILSWEQLSARTMGVDELGTMLSDMAAPFTGVGTLDSRAGSPSPIIPSLSKIPESPLLTAMPSPGGYGSISQVLLPAVTPSPAPRIIHRENILNDDDDDDDDDDKAAIAPPNPVPMLRLKVAKTETLAKERLQRIEALEQELHEMRTARSREREEQFSQINSLEERLEQTSLRTMQIEEQAAARAAEIETHMRANEARYEAEAQAQKAEAVRRAKVVSSAMEQRKCVATVAKQEWAHVREVADCELTAIESDIASLNTLLMGLDLHLQQLQ